MQKSGMVRHVFSLNLTLQSYKVDDVTILHTHHPHGYTFLTLFKAFLDLNSKHWKNSEAVILSERDRNGDGRDGSADC